MEEVVVRAAQLRQSGTTISPSISQSKKLSCTLLWMRLLKVCAQQESGTMQGLVSAKSRLAKRNLTIPRLELVSSHMAINLVTNICIVIDNYVVAKHCWLDSTVALYWIQGQEEYKQFVANHVHKIKQHPNVQKSRGPGKLQECHQCGPLARWAKIVT